MYYNKETANKAKAKYAKTHEKQLRLVLHVENDKDIIMFLDRVIDNKNGYLKQLIRDDIARREKELNKMLYGTPEPPVQQVPVSLDEATYSNTPDDAL